MHSIAVICGSDFVWNSSKHDAGYAQQSQQHLTSESDDATKSAAISAAVNFRFLFSAVLSLLAHRARH